MMREIITRNRVARNTIPSLRDTILKTLEEHKAEDIVVIDLAGKSDMADYMIIASGRSNRHVGAVADHLLQTLKDKGLGPFQAEGAPECDWVLVDALDIVVHIFRPEVRSFYNLEKMWEMVLPERAEAEPV